MIEEIIIHHEEQEEYETGSDTEGEEEENSSIDSNSDVEFNDEASDSDSDDMFIEVDRTRTITFNQIKMIEYFPVEGGAFLKCSACSHQLPLVKRCMEGNEIPYLQLEYHMRLVHRLRPKKMQ